MADGNGAQVRRLAGIALLGLGATSLAAGWILARRDRAAAAAPGGEPGPPVGAPAAPPVDTGAPLGSATNPIRSPTGGLA